MGGRGVHGFSVLVVEGDKASSRKSEFVTGKDQGDEREQPKQRVVADFF
jgi:hypothetical protein